MNIIFTCHKISGTQRPQRHMQDYAECIVFVFFFSEISYIQNLRVYNMGEQEFIFHEMEKMRLRKI